MSIVAWNEISPNSNGGTEMVMRFLESELDEKYGKDFQIIPSRVRDLDHSRYRIYHIHDLPWDPETNHLKDHNSVNRFHRLVFVSNWQRAMYQAMLGVPVDERSVVLETPVKPISYVGKPKDVINFAYTSTPQRGLEILVPVFIELCNKYDNIYLDVFSSFAIYGWESNDEPYKDLFEICKNHPKIRYHGVQPNDTVRYTLQQTHVLAYPSIWPECCSRSVIEAMSAGCAILSSDLAGIPDTTGMSGFHYTFTADMERHKKVFYDRMENLIQTYQQEGNDFYEEHLLNIKSFSDHRFNGTNIVHKWERMLDDTKIIFGEAGITRDKSQVVKLKL